MTKFANNHLDFIDPRLIADCFFIEELELSTLLLMNDANYPWLILVPRLKNIYDLTDLDYIKQRVLLEEINLCGEFLKKNFIVDKLNIASLGNVVKQLHIHIIARKIDDVAYPKPVWGVVKAKKYTENNAQEIINKLKQFITNKTNNNG